MTNDAELRADLELLRSKHGINDELIRSLQASKSEARAHILFFKRMTFITSILCMTIGLLITAACATKLLDKLSGLFAIGALIGAVIFFRCTLSFMTIIRAVQATEAVARKHDLI